MLMFENMIDDLKVVEIEELKKVGSYKKHFHKSVNFVN